MAPLAFAAVRGYHGGRARRGRAGPNARSRGLALVVRPGQSPSTSGPFAFSSRRCVSYETISTEDQLAAFCDGLAGCRTVALDTEFVSESTYRPVLCLVQVEAGGRLALIDSMAVRDLTPFWRALVAPGHETIVHAGRGEVEFCLEAVGQTPAGLIDVQIAAGLAGIEYPAGFGTLLNRLLGLAPKKEETRTDWRRRPLSKRQIEYALDDARYLPRVWDALRPAIAELGRAAWLAEEMAAWQEQVRQAFTQERWRRVSGGSGLSARGLAVLRELWRWRDAEARRRDCPARRVLRDDLMVELARRQTASLKRIRAVRGLDRGDLQRHLPKLAECIQKALDLPDDQLPAAARHNRVPELALLGQFLYSALGTVCRQARLSPGIVGTPTDVRELIAYRTGLWDPGEPPLLSRGWRADFIGPLFDDLLAGKASVRIVDPTSDHPLAVERPAPDGPPAPSPQGA